MRTGKPDGVNTRPFTADDLALIDRFRGLPRNPLRKTRAPADLAGRMDRILSALRINGGDTPESAILAHWADIVGPQRTSRCTPARLQRDGTLVILAPNPVVRQELAFDKRAIVSRIRKLPGCGLVRSIVLRGG
ncbi:MAG: DUF721 domain-containing protein [Puniceicoccaceae bacterium]